MNADWPGAQVTSVIHFIDFTLEAFYTASVAKVQTPVMRRVLGLSIGTVVLAIVIFLVWAKRQQELHAKENRQQTLC